MTLPKLQPGDYLLYDVDTAFHPWFMLDLAIRLKTWSRVAHVEIYDGPSIDGQWQYSLASRFGGVNRYPFRRDGLVYVIRPKQWDHKSATAWFEKMARGQGYDYIGLLCFTLAVKRGSPNKQFCSEFGRNLAKFGGWKCFADMWPGDKTAPGSFLMAPNAEVIWALDENDPMVDNTARDLALAS